jgi:cytidylate kinase
VLINREEPRDYQSRVVKEQKELDEKIEKLQNYLDSEEKCSILPKIDVELLKRQLKAMTNYSIILGARIAKFMKNRTS